ncbi:hypothetical protein SVIOM342S_09394 [Streptomyces violaceorubidus]
MQVAVAAHPGRVDDGQRAGLGGQGGGQSAQRPVEQAYALGVGADEQRVLHVLGVAGRRGRLHAAASADRAQRRLPHRLPAPAAEGAEQTGGEQRRGEQCLGQPEGVSGLSGGGRGVFPARAGDGGGGRDGVRGRGRGPLLGQGDLGVAAALLSAASALGVVAGPGVVADLLLHLLGDVRRLVGHLDQLAAAGVAGHLHDPAGPDERGLRQPGPVGLHAVLVELEDLLVAPSVAQVPFGHLPRESW